MLRIEAAALSPQRFSLLPQSHPRGVSVIPTLQLFSFVFFFNSVIPFERLDLASRSLPNIWFPLKSELLLFYCIMDNLTWRVHLEVDSLKWVLLLEYKTANLAPEGENVPSRESNQCL